MRLPKYHETFIPILEVLKSGESIHYRKLMSLVINKYYSDLPEVLLEEKTKSGKNTLSDRIAWGKSYLKQGKFVIYPQRGEVQITQKGKDILKGGILTLQDLKKDADFLRYRELLLEQKVETETMNDENASPQDLIDSGFSAIENEVKSELLEKLRDLDPYYFEKVILILLKKMGYGDFIETTKSNDGGIDGIINEDNLGLDKIYIQAKRYSDNKVREKEIRNFIGAMSGDTRKGVFVTTSDFDGKAIKKANDAHHSIILINGVKLVDLMHEFKVGVQVKTVYEIRELDNDFFEGE